MKNKTYLRIKKTAKILISPIGGLPHSSVKNKSNKYSAHVIATTAIPQGLITVTDVHEKRNAITGPKPTSK